MYIPQVAFTRFVAVLAIIIWHFGRTTYPFNQPVISRIIDAAPWGVSYFFSLSGFILVIAYRGADREKTIDAKTFWAARLARLYPVYLLSVVLFLFPFLFANPSAIRPLPVLLNIFLVQAWFPPYPIYMNGPAWALSALAFFYALFPFLLPFMSAMSKVRLAVFLAVVWAASLAAHVVLLETIYPGAPSVVHDVIFYNPLFHVNAFIFGIGGGLLLLRLSGRTYGVFPLLVMALLCAALALIVLVPNPLGKYCHDGMLSPLWMLALLSLSCDRSVFSRFLAARPLVLLGEVSFGMYIFQRPIYGFVVELFGRFSAVRSVTTRFTIYLLLLFLVSWMSYTWIEKPARSAIKRWYAHVRGRREIGGA